jgi:hypothetical protein
MYLNALQLIQSDTASDKGLTEIDVKDPDKPMTRRDSKTITIIYLYVLSKFVSKYSSINSE